MIQLNGEIVLSVVVLNQVGHGGPSSGQRGLLFFDGPQGRVEHTHRRVRTSGYLEGSVYCRHSHLAQIKVVCGSPGITNAVKTYSIQC